MDTLGVSIQRKEAWDKVTGAAKYNDDYIMPGLLHAKMVTSPYAHAKIKSIDIIKAMKVQGVQAIITGDYHPVLSGTILEDHPPVAIDKVRYFGEPVAVVVANSEYQAGRAADLIKVEYEQLPVVNSLRDALKPNAVLVHENLIQYTKVTDEVYPEANTNIANHIKVRKGDISKGWQESEVIIEASYSIPQGDHAAMETRNCKAEILPSGEVIINTSSQAPFAVKKMISQYFKVDIGKVTVHTPLVGGGFGGKAPVQLEMIAYLASKAVGGRKVLIANTRREDLVTSPCRLGLEGKVKLGAKKDGTLKAVELIFTVDGGAYADITPRMTKAMAVDGTGPYRVDNVWCDALSVYTNHPYATSFRGFGHAGYTFCIERAMDKLAYALGMDPIELRLKNAIKPQDTTPTQVKMTTSNLGDIPSCINKVKELIRWAEGTRKDIENNKIRAKGFGCFWKTSTSPTDASSGVILKINQDGSICINSGVVEIGPGMKTTLAQILAEKMKMDITQVHVEMEVNTKVSPEHWKTVASMTTFLAGNAVLQAAEDVINQLKSIGSIVLKCKPNDLEVGGGKVYLKSDPSFYIDISTVAHGYMYPNGNSIGGQIIGRGSYMMRHLTPMNKDTGQGKTGPAWTVGAQAVEIEYDKKEFTFKILKAATVIDAGKVINPKTAKGIVMGGVSMGIGMATREHFVYNDLGVVENTSLRTYKLLRYGENPEYLVDFIETPQTDAPFGARGFSEHGIIAISAALGNALSTAAEIEINQLPITPEMIWKLKGGSQ